MDKNHKFEYPILFTTGAHIQPLRVFDETGNEWWFWVVSEFVDDSFLDGEILNPTEYGLTKNELFLEK